MWNENSQVESGDEGGGEKVKIQPNVKYLCPSRRSPCKFTNESKLNQACHPSVLQYSSLEPNNPQC